MSTTSIGRQAEQIAADYLGKNHKLKLISQNWRTRTCEIDLVMQKDSDLYFIEVKYRKNSFVGGGLSSITASKLAQMQAATEEWQSAHPEFEHYQPHLSVVELSDKPPQVNSFIKDLEI